MSQYKSRHTGEQIDDALDRLQGIDNETLVALKNQSEVVSVLRDAVTKSEEAKVAADAAVASASAIQSTAENIAKESATQAVSKIAEEANVAIRGIEDTKKTVDAALDAQEEWKQSVDTRLGNVDLEHFGDLQSQLHTHRERIDNVDRKVNEEITARTEAIANVEKKAKEYADSAGKIKTIRLNGKEQAPDEQGAVDLMIDGVDETKVSQLVEQGIKPYKTPKFNVEAETDDEGVTLTFTSEEGDEIASTKFAGGGSGSGSTSTARIVMPLVSTSRILKKGDPLKATYSYNHLNADGSETGTTAQVTLSISINGGAPITTTRTLVPSTKQYEIDLSEYAKNEGTISVRLTAIAEDGLRKNSAVSIEVRTLSLSLQSTEVITKNANGGHTGNISVPFYISGAGNKTVTVVVNGKDTIVDSNITAIGTQVRNIIIPSTLLSEGSNSVQMRAEADGIVSQCVYFNVLFNPHGKKMPFVGLYVEDTKADLLTAENHGTPIIKGLQYEDVKVRFITANINAVSLEPDGKTFVGGSQIQEYVRRFKQAIKATYTLAGEGVSQRFTFDVDASGVSLSSSEVGLLANFDADGRSNAEANKDEWTSGEFHTTFDGVDFKSSGWEAGALVLKAGAMATVGYQPFATDPAVKGFTLELEVKTDTVMDEDVPVISCLDNGRGFAIYPSKAALLTGNKTEKQTEDGTFVRNEGVEMSLSTEDFTRIVFVVHSKDNYRLMELYAGGVRIKADVYAQTSTFMQETPQPIIISSSDANVSVKQIKAYERALSDDEVLNNYITSRTSTAEMVALRNSNDVLDSAGKYATSRTSQRGRLIIKRTRGLMEVFRSTNKKEDFLCEEVRYESPFGSEYDFVAKNIYIRIQGTSSTKYPWKNIRLYLNKGDNPQLWVNGVLKTGTSGDAKADAKKNKYAMSPTAKAVSVFTCKCDYSDSSMAHNTGGAMLWDYITKKLGFLTPPQIQDINVRTSIEGYPCDIYNQNEDGTIEYYGQYNFNNDKSKSDEVFGMKGAGEGDLKGCMSLEFLNNTNPFCLFKTKSANESDYEGFDGGLEFNIPEDTYLHPDPSDSKQQQCTDEQKAGLMRLWNFIGDCARACGVQFGDEEKKYNDVARFKSERFKQEANQYFDINNMLLWYLFTDYFAMVDQRAKNMILRTWDGNKWYFTYYDGDTMLGARNDSTLAYDYDIERNTFDVELNKYAFEGHSSWLWGLVLANFEEEMRVMAQTLRKQLTDEILELYLNKRQMRAWSKRAYNKSGYLKYIVPATKGTEFTDAIGSTTNQISNYIYGLQGDRYAHRKHFIKKRNAFLDARYMTEAYRGDNIDAYISRTESEKPSVVKITASEKYRFGYGTNNKPYLGQTGEVKKGEQIALPITGAFTANDPIRIYGASAMRELHLSDIVPSTANTHPLQNGFVLTKCADLRVLDMGLDRQVSTSGLWLNMDGLTSLETINVQNINGIAINAGASSHTADLSKMVRLKLLNVRGTGISSVVFAEGCLIETFEASEAITTLTLRSLPKLSLSGMSGVNWGSIERLNLSACPLLEWETLLAKCSNVKNIRIEGVDLNGDGSDLDRWKTLGGLSADGSIVEGARFVGHYQLTKFREDIAGLRECFPDLEIRQAKYTILEQDELSKDNSIISNLDNNTGFKFGNTYAPSGHISKILAMRHWVMVRLSQEGTPTYTQLSDEDGTHYLNGTPAVQDGTNGVVCVYEPRYWYKGVNDWYGHKKYAIFTSEAPEASPAVKLHRTTLRRESDTYINPGETLLLTFKEGYVVYYVPLGEEVKMVRWPALQDTITVAVFVDASKKVVKTLYNPSALQSGMYLVSEKPDGAVELVFQFKDALNDYFDHIVLSPTTDIADIEPDWVEHPATLVSACKHVQMDNGELLSVVSKAKLGLFPVSSDIIKSTCTRHGKGWTLIDYDQYKDVLWLSIAQWGQVGGTMSITDGINSKSNGKSLAQPLSRRFKGNGASRHLYLRGEEWLPADYAHFMGYDALGNGHLTRIGGILAQSGKWIIDGRKFWNIVDGDYITLMIHERYMDFLPLTLVGTSIARYGVRYDSWGSNTFGAPRLGTVGLQSTSLASPNWSIRLQYRGEMTEVSNEDYIELWK